MFYKQTKNGYIGAIGKNIGGTEISESEYTELLSIIQSAPVAPDGYAYRLRADDLEWELAELPPAPEYEPTIEDKAEAYDILMGEEESE